MNMTMNHEDDIQTLQAQVASRLEDVRKSVHEDHGDPRALYDDVQRLIDRLEAANLHVPDELREYGADLEAEIVEDFFDNLPV